MTGTPAVFRPRRLRIVGTSFAVALCVLSAFGWFALPASIRVLFTVSQRLTLLALLAVLVGAIALAASSRVRADDQGLLIRNGLRTHTVPWARVHKVLLRPGDPWALVLVKPLDEPFVVDLDADKRIMLGIQGHDGAYAEAAVAELRRRQHAAQTGQPAD